MKQAALREGHDPAESQDAFGFRWHVLKEQAQAFLEGHGVPPRQAERLSHEVIVRCAREVETVGTACMDRCALNEARIMLEGWRAVRQGRVSAAA